jgi:hypothetical protein
VDYRDIDWQANRPDLHAVADDWVRTTITPVPKLDKRLTGVVDALNATNVNGGAQVAQVAIDAAPAVMWALARNRLDEFGLLDHLFRHAVLREVLPAVAGFDAKVEAFEMENTFTAFGRLVGWIKAGGAYERFAGSDEDALNLATDFMRAVCDLRLSETFTWVNWSAWTPWFRGIAWDGTLLWFDTRRGVVTVLLTTDTD